VKIYMDWEFLEDGKTIEPISVGIVAEDGMEYYAAFRDMPAKRIAKHDWLMANVWPGLPRLHGDARMHAGRQNPLALDWQHPDLKPRKQIRDEVRKNILDTPDAELWGWYSAYDHVCLAQLFGRMIDLPDGIPMWTNDLKQEHLRLGEPLLPEQDGGLHNALADARHIKVMAEHLDAITRKDSE
jgi:hypothetical protein